MTTAPTPNHRASLLAGLRTGGVRSTSGPMGNIPHTAAPGGSFNVPRFASASQNEAYFPEEEEEDELADMVNQNLYIRNNNASRFQQPMTAAVDGGVNRFAQQQGLGMNANVPMSPFAPSTQSQLQAMQLQMMQMEIVRLQAIQAQQYQAELLTQQMQQRQAQQSNRRSNMGFNPPATAGPMNTSFDLRSTSMNAQQRRSNQAEQLRAKLGVSGDDQVPMTAALGGKFGSRMTSGGFDTSDDDLSLNMRNPPSTPNYTTVISGGTSLGNAVPTNGNGASNIAPSKSDAAVSWRRGPTNNSVLNGNRAASSPLVKITPPPSERVSPPPSSDPVRTRPQPLRFTAAASQPLNAVAVDSTDGGDADDNSSVSSKSNSSPSTPRTSSSTGDMPPLSPREEAAKKLYEGLGIGRPAPAVAVITPAQVAQRLVSQPMRQPRGPPSNNDELLPKNFATRSRRKAIGALGALLDARERREVIEAF